jgi:hypothetical protein
MILDILQHLPASDPPRQRISETTETNLSFFPEPFPDKDPEEIETEQIFVDRSRPPLNHGEEHPLKGHPDILKNERDYSQQVHDRIFFKTSSRELLGSSRSSLESLFFGNLNRDRDPVFNLKSDRDFGLAGPIVGFHRDPQNSPSFQYPCSCRTQEDFRLPIACISPDFVQRRRKSHPGPILPIKSPHCTLFSQFHGFWSLRK